MEAINEKKLPIQLQEENHDKARYPYKERIDYLQKRHSRYCSIINGLTIVIILMIIVLVSHSLINPHHYGNLSDDLIIPAATRLTSTIPFFGLIWRYEIRCDKCNQEIKECHEKMTNLDIEHRKTIRTEYPSSGDFIKVETISKQIKLTPITNNRDPIKKINQLFKQNDG